MRNRSPRLYVFTRVLVEPSGCWTWLQCKRNGYGRMVRGGKTRPAHAFAWEAWNGPLADGMQVNHRCHNRACCNPDHLYAGTQLQNMADMYASGRERVLRGEENGLAKLTAAQVREIRKSTDFARLAAGRFGVSESLIYAIRKNKIWRHVDAQ